MDQLNNRLETMKLNVPFGANNQFNKQFDNRL